ncbi:MAG: hypothetical protein K6E22_00520 [Treponema sp.]|nr:hypothetical protein [Treponema sp.]
MKKLILALGMALLSVLAEPVFSSDFLSCFNSSKFTKEQIQDLKEGKVVIRNLKSPLESGLKTSNIYANKFLKELKATSPTHFAEIMQVRPYKGNENLIAQLANLVTDIKSYRQIPYYTERHGAWAAMFTKAEVVSVSRGNLTSVYNAVFRMPPFAEFDAQVSTTQIGDTLYFATKNKGKIEYKIFDAVKPEKMECGLVLFREGDYWILYGAGAVKTNGSPFVKKRVNRAFVNRIKDFSMYFIKKLN